MQRQAEQEIAVTEGADRVAARFQIQDVVANFAHGLDDRNAGRWLSVFDEDAVLVLDAGSSVYTGHDEILEKAKEMWQLPAMSHLTGNHIVDFVDDTHANGLSRGFGLFQLPDLSFMLTTVRIEDEYLKRDGIWKIARCTVGIISSTALQTGDVAKLPK